MQRYTEMADEILSNEKGGDINADIAKYASSHKLNINQQQRLIEEVNVGSFLNRLKDGTQHEDYQIAEPVQALNPESTLDKVASHDVLEKVATEDLSSEICESMFHMSMAEFDDADAEATLAKTASFYDDNPYTVEEADEKADELRKEASDARASESDSISRWGEEDSAYEDLVKSASYSDGFAKTIVVALAKMDLEKVAEDIMVDCKFSSNEISSAVAEPLPEEVADVLMKVAAGKSTPLQSAGKIAKNLYLGGKGLANAAGGIVAFPFKHKKTAAGLLTAGVAGKVLYDSDAATNEQLKASNYATGDNYGTV